MENDKDLIFSVLKRPVATEKVVRMINTQNTLCFAVDRRASKEAIKKAIESYFEVKVAKINTYLHPKGEKRAYVTLSKDFIALDVATQLGLL